jgi:hypothetical protein
LPVHSRPRLRGGRLQREARSDKSLHLSTGSPLSRGRTDDGLESKFVMAGSCRPSTSWLWIVNSALTRPFPPPPRRGKAPAGSQSDTFMSLGPRVPPSRSALGSARRSSGAFELRDKFFQLIAIEIADRQKIQALIGPAPDVEPLHALQPGRCHRSLNALRNE